MFETFDHTADIGLRVRAASLDELFVDAARGFTSLLLENPEDIRLKEVDSIRLAGTETDYLLFDWLNELLFRFESRGLMFGDFQVQIDAQGLTATMRGEPCDRSRHRLSHEVKAITYHGLCVEQVEAGWQVELILDI